LVVLRAYGTDAHGLANIPITRLPDENAEEFPTQLQQADKHVPFDFINPPTVLTGLPNRFNQLLQTIIALEKVSFSGDHLP